MSIVVIMKAGRPYMPQRPVDFSALQGKFGEIFKLLLRILKSRPSTEVSVVLSDNGYILAFVKAKR